VLSLLVFFSYAIVLNTVVPISLYVSVEVTLIFICKKKFKMILQYSLFYGASTCSVHDQAYISRRKINTFFALTIFLFPNSILLYLCLGDPIISVQTHRLGRRDVLQKVSHPWKVHSFYDKKKWCSISPPLPHSEMVIAVIRYH